MVVFCRRKCASWHGFVTIVAEKFLQIQIMKKVCKSLFAGICVIAASFSSVFAGNTLVNGEIPSENTTGVITSPLDINIKLIETNINPFAKKNLVVELRDMMGKFIYTSGAAAVVNGQPAVDVDMPQLAKGVYSYSVYDEKENLLATGKYVKE
jgi:hypothetical protein